MLREAEESACRGGAQTCDELEPVVDDSAALLVICAQLLVRLLVKPPDLVIIPAGAHTFVRAQRA